LLRRIVLTNDGRGGYNVGQARKKPSEAFGTRYIASDGISSLGNFRRLATSSEILCTREKRKGLPLIELLAI
jgi:hypothetical protein